MVTQKLQQIGQGANSRIYEGYYSGIIYNGTVALKQFNYASGATFVKARDTHAKIKRAGLPTLTLFEKGQLDGEEFLVLEHINTSATYKYVSYNTVNNGGASDAEDARLALKLDNITDFTAFLEKAKKNVEQYTLHDVSVYFDAYFFGSELLTESTLDYKIVDLDNIEFFDHNYSFKEKREINLSNFKDAIDGFVRCFVTDSLTKNSLRQEIEDILK